MTPAFLGYRDTEEKLSRKQIEKGIIILVAFVILRAILAKAGGVEQGVQFSMRSILFLISTFLILSVCLVYLGFAKWVGIDLKQWWRFDRRKIPGDIGWGILGFIMVLILSVAILIPVMKLGFISENIMNNQPSIPSPIEFLLTLFFGLAIAGFQEETIFRGFLQSVLTEKFGHWQGNILQAAVFSIAHIGYYPLNAWPLFIIAFIFGTVFGWLKMKRGTLITPWIAHGLFG